MESSVFVNRRAKIYHSEVTAFFQTLTSSVVSVLLIKVIPCLWPCLVFFFFRKFAFFASRNGYLSGTLVNFVKLSLVLYNFVLRAPDEILVLKC